MTTNTRLLLQRLSLRHLRGQWLRTLLSLLGVMMGVATFIFAPTVANAIQASIDLTVDDFAGRSVLEVRDMVGFSPDALETVRQTPGVALAAPVVNGGGLVLGQPEIMIFFGIDDQIDREVRSYALAEGEFLSGAGQVLLVETYAHEKGFAVGDMLTVISAGGAHDLRVVGLLTDENGVARLNSGDMLVMAAADAQALRGSAVVDIISIMPAEGQNIDTLAENLRAVLPENLKVQTPSASNQALQEFNGLIVSLITIVCLIILAIGSTLIYNTMAVSVAQRRAEIGILRALGVTRGKIQTLYIIEAAVLGTLGSLLGIPLGFLLVALGSNLPVMPQFSSFNMLTSEAAIVVPLWLIPIALFMGIALPVLAGYVPSRAAARIDPIEAMVQIRAESGTLRLSRKRVLLGALLITAMLLIRYGLQSGMMATLVIANFGIFMTPLVIGLLLPVLLVTLSGVLPGVMQRVFGIAGMLAASNLTRRPKRIVSTGFLLALAAGLGVYISQSNFGYHEYIDEWAHGENIGDLTLMSVTSNPLVTENGLPADVVAEIGARADVVGVIGERQMRLERDGRFYMIRALDMQAFRALGGRFPWNTGDEAAAYTRLLDAERPAVLLAASFSVLMDDITTDSRMALETPNGALDFEVVGTILGGVSTDQITIIMDRGLYMQLWGDTRIDRLMITLAAGANVQQARRELLRAYALRGVMVFENAEITAAFASKLTSIGTVSSMLSTLLIAIIVAGLGSTLFVLVLDRRREIGMLRAVGMLRRQITGGIVLEALLLLLLACIVGVPVGLLGMSLQSMSMQNIMGIRFAASFSDTTATLLMLLATVLAAAYFPARIAGRTDVLEAMRYE